MDDSPINRLPQDILHQIFSSLPLRQIMICRSVSKLFNQMSPHPVASANGLIYLWGESPTSIESNRSLVVCNPLTRQFQVLPQLGSAWSRHGSVLVNSVNHRVMVLTELAALYFSNTNKTNSWSTFSANLPSKPRSPILISDSVFALCDVGSPWRSQWKLFTCILSRLNNNYNNWVCLERHEWGDIFDIIKRPRLVRGKGNKLLMTGKSNFSLNSSCSTILILRLDLERLEWEEAGRMPVEMYRSFQEPSKLKVFGGGDRVCFSAKRVGKLALWDDCDGAVWRWIEGVPGGGDGLCRGFVFEAKTFNNQMKASSTHK
ncbi:hypothetical protein SADUNF_Sadunf02G0058000 [Salix dunnii]|uniref:F-box domain-containing protein n=1 Tax=Salix dunnii TaxID=1413687 RepID=A0A835N6H7_9ROSI|nr:hypothetical protein SADUNF_Sadunf02G0058000 [Salix dunnii]